MSKRKNYTKEFKTEAVNMVLNEGKSTEVVGNSLGVHPTSVRQWVKDFKKLGESSFPGHGNQTPSEKEISALKKEVKTLKMEKEFLKKASAYFAKETL